MIAVSRDQGATWSVLYQQKDGDMLLKIEFVNDRVGHAAGTGGLLLTTTDGGQTWIPHRSSGATIRDFSFSTPTDGIALLENHAALTSDGGEHWNEMDVWQRNEKVRPYSEIESIAALDLTHYALALHQPEGENLCLSTTDGGKNWAPQHIDNTFAGTLAIHDGEYWAFGIEYLGRDKPGGGYSAPVALHSTDGQTWQHGVRASTEFNACTTQGCSLHHGVIEVLYSPSEKIWSTPQDAPLTSHWAISGNRVCTVDQSLKCGSLVASDAPQPMPESNKPISITLSNGSYTTGCISCGLNPFPPKDLHPGQNMLATVNFSIHRDGSVGDVRVQGTPAPVADEIKQQMSSWLIAPEHNGDSTIPSQRTMQLVVQCFPGFPGHPELAQCNFISAAKFREIIERSKH